MRKLFRIIISRYALSAVLILAEIALIAYLAFYAYTYSWIFVFLASAVNILVIISLVNRDTNPEFKLTWLAVVTLVPVFGGVLYILFYSRRMKKKEARYLEDITRRILEEKERSGSSRRSLTALDELSRVSEQGSGSALSILRDDALAEIYSDTETRYYPSGEELFSAMLEAISGAKRYIFLEYFIVEDGKMWSAIHKLLMEKVEEGVEVRMLYDDIGCMSALPADFARRMRARGIKCHRFAKITPRFSASHNNRDHRKICVVDGRVAFTGGVNIADEYINAKSRFGHWKDGGIECRGRGAEGFARLFLLLYDFTTGKPSEYSSFFIDEGADAKTESCSERQNAPSSASLREGGGPSLTAEVAELPESHSARQLPWGESPRSPLGEGAVKHGFVIPFGSGPAPVYPEPVGKNALMNIINIAKRYIYITTPYFIIDYDLTEALRNAAKRGVDVRIITPAIADKKIVKIMTKSSYPYLIFAGVRIFEYTPGFIHEKLVVSDDFSAIVSTINFDYRSLAHHFEDGLRIFGSPAVYDIRDSFLKTEATSCEILPENAKLGIVERIIRNLIRIFAPLL